jgi:hypothetical protein
VRSVLKGGLMVTNVPLLSSYMPLKSCEIYSLVRLLKMVSCIQMVFLMRWDIYVYAYQRQQ